MTHEVEHQYAQYELKWNDKVIKIGDKIKFKSDYNVYLFRCLVFDTRLEVEWIECWSAGTGRVHRFHPAKLRGPVEPKKSRAKKRDK